MSRGDYIIIILITQLHVTTDDQSDQSRISEACRVKPTNLNIQPQDTETAPSATRHHHSSKPDDSPGPGLQRYSYSLQRSSPPFPTAATMSDVQVLKPDKDFSKEVDKQLPEAESLALVFISGCVLL